jgi:hypothetical protein
MPNIALHPDVRTGKSIRLEYFNRIFHALLSWIASASVPELSDACGSAVAQADFGETACALLLRCGRARLYW